MSLRLYDLCLDDRDIRPSPHCWLAKFALLHKGLSFDVVPLQRAEKQNYPDPDYGLLPMLEDDGELVRDSAVIIEHLERKYPARPLTANEAEKATAAFYKAWRDAAIFPALGPLVMRPLFAAASVEDQAHIRAIFSSRLGKTVEEYADTPGAAEKLRAALAVLAAPLAAHEFLGGATPDLSDYTLFTPFIWARIASQTPVIEFPAPVSAWSERMLDLFDGYARKAKRVMAA
ncbi:MAG TPA: glutathione S-transferase N-terminal domain-containing protein [Parvularculaceae bacterium]|nr:glutathione S-transferase N-terminal domain-containing protein [Parvularculaceae bacterium]